MKHVDIQKQYDDFHTIYTDNLAQNELSNTLFHSLFEDIDVCGKKILDIGCGDGVDLMILKKRGTEVFGIDPSIEFLKKAQNNYPVGFFKNGRGEAIPYDDATFDIVYSKWAMQTSPDISAIMREMARVIKKDGTLVFLSKHPWMQWIEKVRDFGHGADYYKQMIVQSNIYSGTITLQEPSHTIGEYFNTEFFSNFEIMQYQEGTDFSASEQINGDIYPTFFMVYARRK
jgi:ubiquinone/menaquinone biosynthesis C-methylase UbiE